MIGETLALSAALCYAVAAVLYKKALGNISYLSMNLVRTVFATLLLLATLPATQYHSSTITFNQLALIVIGSVFGLVIGDTLYYVGLKKIGISRAQPISSSYPLYSMFLAAVILNERLTLPVAAGTPLVVVGIALISLNRNEKNDATLNSGATKLGVTSSIIAPVFWSIGLALIKMALNYPSIDPIFAAFISRMTALPFLLFAVIAAGELNQIGKLTRVDVTIPAVGGMLEIGLGAILLFSSLALIDASRAIPLSSTYPLFSLVLASIYSGEKVGAKNVVGTMLIVAGIILVTFLAQ